jgi:hypothetical protein
MFYSLRDERDGQKKKGENEVRGKRKRKRYGLIIALEGAVRLPQIADSHGKHV